MRAMPTPEEWARAFGLTRHGSEWRGECPLCGFRQFHVGATPDGRAVVGCRRCMDHLPPDARRQRFGALIDRVSRAQPTPPK